MTSKPIVWGSVVLGIVLVGISAVYFTHAANTLPHYFPGYNAGVSKAHFKHGLGAVILAIGLFIFAWFKSAPTAHSI
jgi:amino acid permease